jgi:hypothetical protein
MAFVSARGGFEESVPGVVTLRDKILRGIDRQTELPRRHLNPEPERDAKRIRIAEGMNRRQTIRINRSRSVRKDPDPAACRQFSVLSPSERS